MPLRRAMETDPRRAVRRRAARWGWRRRWGLGALVLGAPFAQAPLDFAHAQTLPQGGNIVGGSGNIQQTSSTQLTINQSSQNLSIDWQSFSIGAGHIVRFNQPNSSALALNRVIGPDPSQIFGSIQANGRVVLMNPNGIYFGPSSMVDVNGLVATTARQNQADFLAGTLNFSVGSSDPNARVVNEGAINVVQGGFAVLAAAAVENRGTVIAQGGTVVLAGTPTFTLDFHGDGLLKFAATGLVTQAPNGANALVDNSGTIQANGGRVIMTARSARDVINNVINTTGIVEARSARVENGEIVIDGGDHGIVSVNGIVNASGNAPDARGGNVTVLGEKIGLFENARLDVSGAAGGGQALVGGNYMGQGPEPNAKMVYMDARAVIDASATGTGDGGRVILWSDEVTRNAGHIDVSGAVNGGFIEVSSKVHLDFRGTVNLRGVAGRAGELLLDPTDITIAASGSTGGMSGSSPFAGTAASSILDVSVLNAALSGGTVTVTTASAAGGTGNIDITAGIVNGATNTTLILRADGAITIAPGGSIGSGGYLLNVSLRAAGNITVGGSGISTLGGYIETTGTTGSGLAGGNFASAANINAGSGHVTLQQTGTIAIGGTLTTSGIVTLNAGGATTQTAAIVGSGSLFVGGTGAVTLSNGSNAFGNITLNRAGTGSNSIDLTTSISPNIQISTLGTGTFSLTGVGFAQAGAITQDASGGAVTIAGGAAGTVTLSQANTFTGAVTVTGQTISVTGAQTATGSGSFSLDATQNVVIGANLTTADGAILIKGNVSSWSGPFETNAPGFGTTPGNFIGVEINGIIDAGSGNIAIAGKGGNTGNYNHGVVTGGSLQIKTAGGGHITIHGQGGPSTGHVTDNGAHLGVTLGSFTGIYTYDGNLKIVGTGGGAGLSENNAGVQVFNSEVRAGRIYGGAGGGTGNLTVTATGGNGGSRGYVGAGGFGLYAETGSLTLTGTGGSGYNVNPDPFIWRSTGVEISGGSAAITYGAGLLTITGTGTGGGAGTNVHGVDISGATTYVRAAGAGGMLVTGTGGNGSGGSNHGILLTTTNVDSTGAGDITLQGTAGAGTGSSGLAFAGGTVTIGGATAAGNMTLRADTMTNSASALAISGSGVAVVKFEPINPGTTIDVNFAGTSTLQLTSNILDAVAPTDFTYMQIGSAAQTGQITTASGWTLGLTTEIIALTAPIQVADTSLDNKILYLNSGGAVTQTGPITGAGTLALVGTGDATLTHPSNNFVDLQINKTGAGSVDVETTGSLGLSLGTMGSGTLALTGAGITQSAPLTQAIGGGAVTLTATGGNAITLTDSSNAFRGDVSLTTTGSGNASISHQFIALQLGTSSVAGNLTVVSGSALTQSGALTVGGAANFTAGAATLDLQTNGTANSFGGTVSLVGGATALINSSGALVLGGANVGGTLTVTAGGTISQTGAIVSGGLASFDPGGGAGNIVLNNLANNFGHSAGGGSTVVVGNVNNATIWNGNAITFGTSGVAGALAVRAATGSIGQSAGTTMSVGTTTSLTADSAGGVVFNSTGNDFVGAVSVTTAAGWGSTIRTSADLHLGTIAVGGAFSAFAGSGIDQAVAMSIGGGSSFSSTTGTIDLSNTGNIFGGPVAITAAGNVAVAATGALTFNTVSIGSGGIFTVSAGGNIDQTGSVTVAGTTSVTSVGGSIDLSLGSNDFTGAVELSNGGNNAIALAATGELLLGNVSGGGGGINITSGGNLLKSSGTSIVQSGGSGAIVLTSTTGFVDLQPITTNGNLTVSAGGGSISQSGVWNVGGNFSATSVGASISLTAANMVGGTVTLAAAGNNVDWYQSGNANFASVSAGTLTVDVTGGSISQVGAMTTNSNASFSATNGITLTNASNAFGGAIALSASSGSASVTTAGAMNLGSVSLSGNLTLVAGATLSQTSTIFAIGGAANLSATGAMTLTNSTNDFGTALTLAGAGGALDGMVNGASGALAAPNVAVANSGFTFGGATLTPPTPPTTVTSTTTVTTETIAQLITQLLTATTTTTASSSSSSTTATDTPGAQTSPAAVQAALTALLSESATPAGGTGTGTGTGQSGDGTTVVVGGGTPAQPAGQGQTATPAPAGTFPAGTTITINTVGGTVASITVTPPAGGGPPQVILPGLLNLTPPVVPSATQSGTPGLTGAFMQNGNFR
jgi:filamentous hemagglutinin family protein